MISSEVYAREFPSFNYKLNVKCCTILWNKQIKRRRNICNFDCVVAVLSFHSNESVNFFCSHAAGHLLTVSFREERFFLKN